MHVRLPQLRSVNNVLTIAVALLAVYIMLLPVLPQFGWWVKHDAPIKVTAAPPDLTPVANGTKKPAISGDVLVIPRLDMQEVIRGGDMRSLRYGVWKIPGTSTPDKGGNTVIAGHRYTYTDPQGVFYFLDKLRVGDLITIYWHGVIYKYKVEKTQVVPPTAVQVEAPTKDATLTLYTCTPLWNPVNRLVVQASLIGKSS